MHVRGPTGVELVFPSDRVVIRRRRPVPLALGDNADANAVAAAAAAVAAAAVIAEEPEAVPVPARTEAERVTAVQNFLRVHWLADRERATLERHAADFEAHCDAEGVDRHLAGLDDAARSNMWASFAISRYGLGERQEQVTRALSNVQKHLLLHGVDLYFLKSDLVRAIRKATKCSPKELKARAERAVERAILPLSDEAFEALFTGYWTDLPWDANFDAPLHRLVAVAAQFAYYSGLRISNYTPCDVAEHCCRGQDVRMLLTSPASDRPVEVKACEWVKGTPLACVVGVKYFVYTSKTGQSAPTEAVSVLFHDDSPDAARLTEMLAEWLNHATSYPQVDQPVFTLRREKLKPSAKDRLGGPGPYYHVRQLQRLDVANAVKWASEQVGDNAAQASTKSLRKRAATKGTDRALTNAGQWVEGSRARAGHYDHSRAIAACDSAHVGALCTRSSARAAAGAATMSSSKKVAKKSKGRQGGK